MNKNEFCRLQKTANLTNKQAVDLLGVSIATIKRWRNGTFSVPVVVIGFLEYYIKDKEIMKQAQKEYTQAITYTVQACAKKLPSIQKDHTRTIKVMNVTEYLRLNDCNITSCAKKLNVYRYTFRKYLASDYEYLIEINNDGSHRLINQPKQGK